MFEWVLNMSLEQSGGNQTFERFTLALFECSFGKIMTKKSKEQKAINPFMHYVEKLPNILLKSCAVNTARVLKYVWPLFNIIHERIKKLPLSFFIQAGEQVTRE